MRKIYFKYASKSKTLENLLKCLFSESGYAKQTFLDKKYLKQDCKASSRRSFEDLMCIANTYFENTSEKDLMQALKNIKMLYYYCHGINKIVFHYNGTYLIGRDFLRCIKSSDNSTLKYVKNTYRPKKLYKIFKSTLKK